MPKEEKREEGVYVFHLDGTNVFFILQQCTSTKISKNKKKKMKKKLKKQIEKQQQQQDEIEQGMLEENEEASDKEADTCCSNSMENCVDNCVENSTNCEQNDDELELNQLQEETVQNLVDSESVENSEDLSGHALQEKCMVTNDDMSVTEEQNDPGTSQ